MPDDQLLPAFSTSLTPFYPQPIPSGKYSNLPVPLQHVSTDPHLYIPSHPFQAEKTFKNYNTEQSQAYAQFRRAYHPNVYNAILTHHTSTGGQLTTILDVGCGPGTTTVALAPYFKHAIGIDPSEGMITTARSQLESNSEMPLNIRFEISSAEELGSNLSPPIAESSVDLLIAANAAHWFDLSTFYTLASSLLRPSGSIALFTPGSIHPHPSMPSAPLILAAISVYHTELLPYSTPGNALARNAYHTLPLPWTLSPPIPGFDQKAFYRKDWAVGEEFFEEEQAEISMKTFEKVMGTASPVTRWREGNPRMEGTERDVVRVLRREVERILREAGVEEGQERLRGEVQGALIVVKRKA